MINRNLLRLFVVSLCLLVFAMGMTVIRGWILQDSSIVQIRPEYVPMQLNTALCFILAASSIWALFYNHRLISLPLGLVGLLFAGLSGLQYLLNTDLGIDTLFLDPFTTVKTSHPGRMAPNTAWNFFMLNAAVIFACCPVKASQKLIFNITTGLIVFSLALIALLGYGADLEGALIWGDFTAMALHTAVSFILLAIAITLVGIYHSDLGNFYEIPWLSHLASGAVLVLTILMWFALQTTTSLHVQHLLNNHEAEVNADIQSYLEAEGKAVRRMASRMDFYTHKNAELFNHDAQTYLSDFNDLAGLAWVNNDGEIQLLQIKDRFKDEPQIQETILTSPPDTESETHIIYDATTSDINDKFIRIRLPATLSNDTRGYFVALSCVETLFSDILTARKTEGFVTSLFMNGRHLVTDGNSPDPRWQSEKNFNFGNVPMDIVVKAAPSLIQELQTHVPTIFLITGLLMALLIGRTLKLFQTSRTLALLVSETNAQLHVSLKETESSRHALEEKSLALEQSNRDLENFAAIASHDLKEPLRKVIMFGERLVHHSGTALDDKGKQYLDVMTSGADRMQTLIESLLAYSRITTKGGDFVDTDLNAVLQDVLSDLAEVIKENNAEISIDALPTLYADYTQMRQLFQNLIANSLRYHKPDINPQIKIHVDKENQAAGRIRIAVVDNGIGFEPENANKIFEVFKRLHTRGEFPGTGMGLAVCKRILERHNGRIRAEGEPGIGAKFILDFPKKPSADRAD